MKLRFTHKETGRQFDTTSEAMRYQRLLRRVRAWCAHVERARERGYRTRLIMITLTYRSAEDWRPNHIRDFIKRVKRHLKSDAIAVAWVAELQKRGAVHYHVLVYARARARLPKPDTAGWWAHGSTRIEAARSRYYIMKYAQKQAFCDERGDVLDFPPGARIFAVWIAPRYYSPVVRWIFRLSSIPGWLSEFLLSSPLLLCADFFRNPGGGWRVRPRVRSYRDSSYILFSPWSVSLIRDLT